MRDVSPRLAHTLSQSAESPSDTPVVESSSCEDTVFVLFRLAARRNLRRHQNAFLDILPGLRAGNSYCSETMKSVSDRFGGFLLHQAA